MSPANFAKAPVVGPLRKVLLHTLGRRICYVKAWNAGIDTRKRKTTYWMGLMENSPEERDGRLAEHVLK